jgi:hypothetical protein
VVAPRVQQRRTAKLSVKPAELALAAQRPREPVVDRRLEPKKFWLSGRASDFPPRPPPLLARRSNAQMGRRGGSFQQRLIGGIDADLESFFL